MQGINRLLLAASVIMATTAVDGSSALVPPLNGMGRYEYSEVVQVEGASAKELYARAKSWVAQKYRFTPAVIELDDPASGRLIVRAFFLNELETRYGVYQVGYTMTVEVTDGRYRYALGDFTRKVNGSEDALQNETTKKTLANLTAKVTSGGPLLVESLKAAMLRPTPASSAGQ